MEDRAATAARVDTEELRVGMEARRADMVVHRADVSSRPPYLAEHGADCVSRSRPFPLLSTHLADGGQDQGYGGQQGGYGGQQGGYGGQQAAYGGAQQGGQAYVRRLLPSSSTPHRD